MQLMYQNDFINLTTDGIISRRSFFFFFFFFFFLIQFTSLSRLFPWSIISFYLNFIVAICILSNLVAGL